MEAGAKPAGSSPKARRLAARLMAAQAVHQNFCNPRPAPELICEYLESRAGMRVEGETMVRPDRALFEKIVSGVEERLPELERLMLSGSGQGKAPEPLLRAILLCGAFEIVAGGETDIPIIINDYLNVTHGFFDGSEAGLVNAVLDSIAKSIGVTKA